MRLTFQSSGGAAVDQAPQKISEGFIDIPVNIGEVKRLPPGSGPLVPSNPNPLQTKNCDEIIKGCNWDPENPGDWMRKWLG